METIQVVLDEELLRATESLAKRRRVNRSALIRDALRAFLRDVAVTDRERRDRAGYAAATDREFAVWGSVTAWPAE